MPAFEAKDLAGSIRKWIGVDGPKWDFERIRVGEQDVIVVVVDPPTGDLWTCRADGEGLVDGGIYIRQDGETRRANGDEVRLLVERAMRKGSKVDVDVAIDGDVKAIRVDASALAKYVKRSAALLRGKPARGRSTGLYGAALLGTMDRRSSEEFLAQVADWERKSIEAPTAGVISLAACVHDGIRVRLRNLTRTFLRDVRLDILFESDVRATDWLPADESASIELFPDRPRAWGTETISVAIESLNWGKGVSLAQKASDVVHIKREFPAMLTMHMNALRPEEEHASDDDEVVLVMLSDSPPEAVRARWRVTARNIDDVFEGAVEVPVMALDWREAIENMLYGDQDEDQQSG